MILTEEQELTMKAAQKGYESYCKRMGGKSPIVGGDLPKWRDLEGSQKNAWFAAADGIILFLAALTLERR